jgi:hypothetical protein
LIPRSAFSVIWGPPKCGKSFVMFDMAMHIALGREYRGRRVEQGAVVYCAFEGAHGFLARVEAWRQEHLAEQADPVPFYLMPATLNLVQECGDLIEAIKVAGIKPSAVVLDTLNRSIQGNEDKGEDMGAYIRASDAIREAFDCAVIVVHHCGYNLERARGHSSLPAAVDASIKVARGATGQVITEVEFMKDGEPGARLASRLRRVAVGIDEDGDEITSCVVEPDELTAPPTENKPPRLTPAAKIALAALGKAVDECGKPPPACNHIPAKARTVSSACWRRYAYHANPDPEATPDARKKGFQRARGVLQAAGLVGVWGTATGGDDDAHCWLA